MVKIDHPIFCHIEIPIHDLEKARLFYEKLFQWDIHVLSGNHYALFPGGGFRRVEENKTGRITPFVQVPDLEASLKKIQDLGGKILIARETAGTHGICAFFEDIDGNILGLYEPRQTKNNATGKKEKNG